MMHPYMIFGGIFLIAIIIGVSVTLLYVRLLGWLGGYLAPYFNSQACNGRGTSGNNRYQGIHFIIFIKHMYYRSHLFNVWSGIKSAIKHRVNKAHIYTNSNNKENR